MNSDNNDKKKLQINENTIITSWQWHATLFSLLQDNKYAFQWILSNYIQLRLVIDIEKKLFFLDFLPGDSCLNKCPYLMVQPVLNIQIEKNYHNILDFIIQNLKMGLYIYGIFDMGKILNKNEKLPHELFIYGYNLVDEYFYVKDFVFNHGKYESKKIPFCNLLNAYNNISNEDFMFNNFVNNCNRGLFLLGKKTINNIYRIDVSWIKVLIKEYLESENTHLHLRMNWQKNDQNVYMYGISIYDGLSLFLEQHEENKFFDVRPLHVLYDHKVLMYERIKYLSKLNIISYELEGLSSDLTAKTLHLRNLYIKLALKEQWSEIKNMKNIIFEIKNEEINLYKRILLELE